ncbi:angiotensinogen isoform X2 [Stegostoma tigrinum]|uniref:angiotensinogen isoform X2 n=1 Tax=Stegostoma tigrinum TaxID=3053191 RepID=UPI00202B6365|nr:angiotensinogen isoform X2 [Stegostoma tigrinum]
MTEKRKKLTFLPVILVVELRHCFTHWVEKWLSMKWIFSLLWIGALLQWGTTNRPYIHPFNLFSCNQTEVQEEIDRNNSFLSDPSGFDIASPINRSGQRWEDEVQWKPSRSKSFSLLIVQEKMGKIWFAKLSPLEGSGVTLMAPFHLYESLATLSLGAGGITAQNFRHHLGLVDCGCIGDQHSWIMRWQGRLVNQDILSRHEGLLETGTWIVVRKGLQLRQAFLWELRWFYPSVQLKAANTSQPHMAEEMINTFIRNATAGRVNRLVNGLSPSTNLVLASYIHFKGKWKNRSQCHGSEFQDFFNDGRSKVHAPMTTWCGKLQYKIDPTYTMIKLPLIGTAYIILVQPVQPDTLESIESTLDVNSIILKSGIVKLVLPQFKWNSTYDVRELYQRMNLPDMLSGRANFSRLNNEQNLIPDQVIQHVIFEVMEDGEKSTTPGYVPFSNTTIATEIRIDKPFFFRVFDGILNDLLLLGRVKKLH